MKLPAGLGETDSIVNLDEKIGKWVGRRSHGPPQAAYARLLKLSQGMFGGRTAFPRGVYRFATHEEADQWMMQQILKRARKP